jgi:hypothetical protein
MIKNKKHRKSTFLKFDLIKKFNNFLFFVFIILEIIGPTIVSIQPNGNDNMFNNIMPIAIEFVISN